MFGGDCAFGRSEPFVVGVLGRFTDSVGFQILEF